ncbi:acyltransferase family protein [Flavobacterium commune]|uniref:Acyltransferase 3 domain-containing protein n=1 Tax=Flavobacterium commune TaxID=1306519 RepID=A0A1D9P8W0_9FLAO|nr:acyltransferase [Flavobacterium commune]AOZ98545.1 hypothetical protein BIW12_03350 [Flavobacterium commune]
MKFKFIDSIRGVAILMVILVHTSQRIDGIDYVTMMISQYGQMGVQLFFLASAYTLCLSAQLRNNESLALIKFGIRRFFRIAPLYYLGILIYLVISLMLSKIGSGEFILSNIYNVKNVISNVTFTHGFYPPANNNIVPGGWSIGTEMAFYSIFPLLFLIANKRINSSLASIFKYVLIGLVFSQLILFTLHQLDIKVINNSFVYYNLINQLPVFLLGIGYFFYKTKLAIELKTIVNLFGFLFFTILSFLLWLSGIDYFFSVIPFISGLSFIFLIELFRKNDFLNHSLLIRIGQLSFSMYLFHFIFAWYITGIFTSKFELINGTVSFLVFYIFTVISTFGIALLSEKYIEQPSIELGRRIIKRIDVLTELYNKKHKETST